MLSQERNSPKSLAFVLSLAVAVSGLPAPALAEAVKTSLAEMPPARPVEMASPARDVARRLPVLSRFLAPAALPRAAASPDASRQASGPMARVKQALAAPSAFFDRVSKRAAAPAVAAATPPAGAVASLTASAGSRRASSWARRAALTAGLTMAPASAWAAGAGAQASAPGDWLAPIFMTVAALGAAAAVISQHPRVQSWLRKRGGKKSAASESAPMAAKSSAPARPKIENFEPPRVDALSTDEEPVLPIIKLKDPLFLEETRELTENAELDAPALRRLKMGDFLIVAADYPGELGSGATMNEPSVFGVLARVVGVRGPESGDGPLTVVVQGGERILAHSAQRGDQGGLEAFFQPLPQRGADAVSEVEDLLGAIRSQVLDLMKADPGFDPKKDLWILLKDSNAEESVAALAQHLRPFVGRDLVGGSNVPGTEISWRRTLFQSSSIKEQLEMILNVITQKLARARVAANVAKRREWNERRDELQRQIELLRGELGKDGPSEAEQLLADIKAAGLPADARRLAEYHWAIVRRALESGYYSETARSSSDFLRVLLSLPWHETAKGDSSLQRAREILDKSHWGLAKVKRFIFGVVAQFLRTDFLQGGKVLALAGPPGTGKTTFVRAIAEALDRPYQFISLAVLGHLGKSDLGGAEAVWVGSKMGKIMEAVRRSGVNNPVIHLDEIDSAPPEVWAFLLNLLDPEQNHQFVDSYLGTPFDLSRVTFIVTANDPSRLPAALRDRLKIVRLGAYSDREKLQIAFYSVIPKALAAVGLSPEQVGFSEGAVLEIIRNYTFEAGVRQLSRLLEDILREVGLRMDLGEAPPPGEIPAEDVASFPGLLKKSRELASNGVGLATGLAVYGGTGVGTVFNVKVTLLERGPKDPGFLSRDEMGQLSRSSVQNAYTYLRTYAATLGVDPRIFKEKVFDVTDIPSRHTDGPSAGMATLMAMVSAATGRPVRRGVAITGELGMDGSYLMIGGIREKALAAQRAGMTILIHPEGNRLEAREEIPEDVREGMHIVSLEKLGDVMEIALEPLPAPGAAPKVRGALIPRRVPMLPLDG
ncbi:MAG: AAA family ATPase [Elusimicrobia bacterium]|nr:AAA family ATPase [Elusimicrobiota bacterium]